MSAFGSLRSNFVIELIIALDAHELAIVEVVLAGSCLTSGIFATNSR